MPFNCFLYSTCTPWWLPFWFDMLTDFPIAATFTCSAPFYIYFDVLGLQKYTSIAQCKHSSGSGILFNIAYIDTGRLFDKYIRICLLNYRREFFKYLSLLCKDKEIWTKEEPASAGFSFVIFNTHSTNATLFRTPLYFLHLYLYGFKRWEAGNRIRYIVISYVIDIFIRKSMRVLH